MNWYKIAQTVLEKGQHDIDSYIDIGHEQMDYGHSFCDEYIWLWYNNQLLVYEVGKDIPEGDTHGEIWRETIKQNEDDPFPRTSGRVKICLNDNPQASVKVFPEDKFSPTLIKQREMAYRALTNKFGPDIQIYEF